MFHPRRRAITGREKTTMTPKELAQLESLTRKFRDTYTWTLPGNQQDEARRRADNLLRDVRTVKRDGGFYQETKR